MERLGPQVIQNDFKSNKHSASKDLASRVAPRFLLALLITMAIRGTGEEIEGKVAADNNQAQTDVSTEKKVAKALLKSKIAAANSTTLPSDSSMRVDAGEPFALPLPSNSSKRGCGSGDAEWRFRVPDKTPVDRKHSCRECSENICSHADASRNAPSETRRFVAAGCFH